jgi:putative transposase
LSGKRHSPDEIAAKLSRANEMMREGKRNTEIAKALGVSLMTYFRWRRDWVKTGNRANTDYTDVAAREPPTGGADPIRLEDLALENARLRRIVTDLLVEKAACEEKRKA